MIELYPFTLKLFSKKGNKILITGISTEEKNEIYFASLKKRFEKWQLSDDAENEAFLIDYYLSRKLIQDTPKNIIALGASYQAKLDIGYSGGIIGDPHDEARSINVYTEELSSGLVLKGLPGGPGIVFRGNHKEAEIIISSILEYSKSESLAMMEKIVETAKDLGISTLIAVHDGSGNTDGVVLSLNKGEVTMLSF